MLKELAVFLCLVGIGSAQDFHNDLASFLAQYPGIQSNANVYVASPDSTYTINPAIVKTIPAPVPVPVSQKKVTIEAHQQVTAHPLTAAPTYVSSQPTIINQPEIQYIGAPVEFGHESVTAHPPSAAYITSTLAPRPVHHIETVTDRPAIQYVSTPVTNSIHSELVKTVSAVPVAAKKVTIEAHQSVTAHPPSALHVTSPPPTAYITSTVVPPVQRVETIVNRPAVQYVSTPVADVKPIYVKPVVPAPSKTVTIEAHQSVTAHPPTPVAAPVRYVQLVTKRPVKPIPVPVIYTAEESPEFASQPIPVPVAYPESAPHVRYNHKVSTPVVYTKSIAQEDYASADLVATNVGPGSSGYVRAVKYSPASAVSSVSFNGNGVSYGW